MKFQYLIGGGTPGHGLVAVHAVNVPVSVTGMDVSPGEIIHMDETGACKFPADKLEMVLTNVTKLAKEEEVKIAALKKAKSAAEISKILSGDSYAKP